MLTAGVHALSAEYLRGLRALCDETGVLLIFDEIVTGFGRLGAWFAAEQAGVWPDILCVGKGLTSGYAPLSAVLLTREGGPCLLGQRRRRASSTRPGHTFAANPVSAACGLAVIRYFEEHGVLENVARARRRARGAPARDRRALPDRRRAARARAPLLPRLRRPGDRWAAHGRISPSGRRCSRPRAGAACSFAPRPTTRPSRRRSS